MTNLNETDLAVLELLVMAPRAYFSPLARRALRKLSRRGLAVCNHGEWFVTKAGIEASSRTLH